MMALVISLIALPPAVAQGVGVTVRTRDAGGAAIDRLRIETGVDRAGLRLVNLYTTFSAVSAPPLSSAGEGRIYFDAAPGQFMVSEDGGAYTPLLGAGGGITSMNAQTGPAQFFANDINVTMTSAANVHTLGWSGQLSAARGGLGADTSGAADGSILRRNAGVWEALGPGGPNEVLTISGGAPIWAAAATDGVGVATVNAIGPGGSGDFTIAGGTHITATAGVNSITLNVSPQGAGSGLDADLLDGVSSVGFVRLGPAVGQTDGSGNPSLFLNKITGPFDPLVELQKSGVTKFTISNAGNRITFADTAGGTPKRIRAQLNSLNLEADTSVVVMIDRDADSTTSRFRIRSNSLASDLFTVGETGHATIHDQAELRLREASVNGTNVTAFRAAAAMAADVIYTLPAADGAGGQILSTDGAGTLSWTTDGGAEVKSGTEAAIAEDGAVRSVAFTTAFAAAPQVTVSFDDGSFELSVCQVENITTTGFDIRVLKIGAGAAVNRDVGWIATDAGNP